MKKSLVAIAVVSSLSMICTYYAPSSPNTAQTRTKQQVQYGVKVSNNVSLQPKPEISLNQTTPHHISDQYAIDYTRKKYGNLVADHMLHRVIQPEVSQHPGIRYGINPTSTSYGNWGGYEAHSSSITEAQGDFNVVSVTGGVDATWTGVGGVNGSGNLAQTGVDMSQLEAWYELYPADPLYVFSVARGDRMFSSVSYDSGTGLWNLLIEDLTTSKYFNDEFSFSPDRTTAEWVVEAQSTIGSFSMINFTQSTWSDSSFTTRTINSTSDSTLVKDVLSYSTSTATPSSIGTDGESFSISH